MHGRTLHSSVENAKRAAYNGYKQRKGSKVHMAVNTLSHLIEPTITLANEHEHSQGWGCAQAVQDATGEAVEAAWADKGDTREKARDDAQAAGIELRVVKLPEAKKGFVLLPSRRMMEHSFSWLA